MVRLKAPVVLWQMLWFVTGAVGQVIARDTSCVDYYAGVGRIRDFYRAQHKMAQSFEKNDGSDQDFLTGSGFFVVVCCCCRAVGFAAGW